MNLTTLFHAAKNSLQKHLLRGGFALLCFCTAPSLAMAAQSGNFTYTVSDGTATLTGYTGAGGAVVIPATLNTWPVATIGFAFRRNESVTSVTIPNGVTTIYPEAFRDCTSLKSVTMGDSVDSLQDRVFFGCTSLESVTIPSSVRRMNESVFGNCSGLTGVTFTGRVGFGERVFENCTSLTSVIIPDGVSSIGAGTFQFCRSLTNVTIPSSVQTIWDDAFRGCHSLTSMTIPNSVTQMNDGVFMNCENLKSVTLPNYVDGITFEFFEGCSSLTSVTLPNSIYFIDSYAFSGCQSLTSVTIPNGVTEIGDTAFEGCSNLTSVTIPNKVASIGEQAFLFCSNLSRVEFLGNAPAMGPGVFYGTASGFKVYYSYYSDQTGFTRPTWSGYNVGNLNPFTTSASGPNGVIITDYPDTAVGGLVIPATLGGKKVVGIAESAFKGCSGLTSVTIPSSITRIGGSAFHSCSRLSRVDFLGNAPTMGLDVFHDNTSTLMLYRTRGASGFNRLPWTGYNMGINDPPLPWVSDEIGAGKLAGYSLYKTGTFTQAGSGALGTTSDKLRFTYQMLSGDGEITAKVISLQNTGTASRVGVMIRESLATSSRQIFIGLSGSDSYRWVRRTTKGGKNATTNSSTGNVPKTWLRLVRKGTKVSAYKSTNGTKWVLVGTTTVTLAKNCYIGLAVASGSTATLNTSRFSNVKVTP